MKLKIDDAGHVVVKDGMPVYVHDDGKELPFDAIGTRNTIARLNNEAKTHREAKEAAEGALAKFAGIEDPAAALKALDTVKNLDMKKLIDAGEVDKVKNEMQAAFDQRLAAEHEKFKPVQKERDALRAELDGERLGNAFARSKFIADQVAVPIDMVQATFGGAFKHKDGKIVGFKDGKEIYSHITPGEVAGFDEALELLIGAYPHKDLILKGTGAGGGGASGGGGGGSGKTMSRAVFDTKSIGEQGAFIRGGGRVTD